ncbi:MAG TPA: HAD hydrolase family protein [Gammaproteobacteria bacterium]|nr:HAD hydrolase family protein [Gammaproteobacteria bacterium]
MTDVREQAARIRLAVFDVDGVFTDGRLYYGADGAETKAFHVRDGHGVKELLRAGIAVAVISGRRSDAVMRRMQELGVMHVFQGCEDKQPVFDALLQNLGVSDAETACVGDDTPDLPLIQRAGLGIAVADAHPAVRAAAALTTRTAGGEGAVREVCDLILAARNPAA